MTAGRRKGLILASASMALSIAALTATLAIERQRSPSVSLAPQFEGLELRSGDVVFRRGRSLVSRSVLALDRDSPFSHVGLIRLANGAARVVHALPPEDDNGAGGIVIEPLETFLSTDKASRAAIYRLHPGDSGIAEIAAEAAYRYALAGVPFDEGFDARDEHALYCTELIWAAYREAGVDLVGEDFVELRSAIRKGSYIFPSTLTKSPRLERLRLVGS